jgi:branched-chain amino acid transport system ATP-binding protein
VVAVLGRNGVGKSTLVNTLVGFVRLSAGDIRVGGRSVKGWPPESISRLGVGLVPQGRRIFASLAVGENIQVATRLTREPGGWTIAKARSAFPRLAERWRQNAGSLSGGEQQLLAIARALVQNSAYLILDEPTEGLAPLFRAELGETIKRARSEGRGVLLVEQDLGFALKVADVVHVMSRGRMVFEGSPAAFRADEEVKARYLGV